ncbi:MAG TPA: DNA mismatch repair endonuclease MutL [Chitinophagaceae bacterium]|nr:DNA mismatch repair endonuclease MutL [Chitinophagaceae bacterium]
MADIIQLLPDNIANQIAAGEVIQRPASAVKELMENAVDAGATSIQLFVNDAGKSLIQVIDNGKGMSETDARMCFERHATSKITTIEDLFRIRTMGFRGEALASIAAVAQVELKTRRADDEIGTRIEIENSLVIRQEPAAIPVGSNIAMKNVFFNVPARRNFLKSNAAELRHIVDEFIRVAMAFPAIFFSFTSNGQQVFHLEKGSLKQRIVQLLGNHYNAKLVTVQEQTDYLNITGFVGKPETAKKTRGDQYFFVNNRFIRSAYLNHAVMNAYQDMIPADSFPLYVLFIELDPAQIDINVHPTKQEIKFEDEKIVYAFVQAAVKHALAQFSITPTLDFDLDPSIQQLDAVSKPFTEEQQAAAASTNLYKTFTQKHQAHFIEPSQKAELKHWRDFYEMPGSQDAQQPSAALEHEQTVTQEVQRQPLTGTPELTQLLGTYIVSPADRGFILVHQQLAHERILYERYAQASQSQPIPVQQSLFPVTLNLASADAVLLQELLPHLQQLGYQVEHFGNNSFIVQGTPADVQQGNEKAAIEGMLEQFKHSSGEIKLSAREKLVRALARQHAIKPGQKLSKDEMSGMIEALFQCAQPNVSPSGNPVYIEFKREYLEKLFGH